MRLFPRLSAILVLAVGPTALPAHEFWIEPLAYQIQPDSEIVADLKVGENFGGSSYPYRPSQITRFDLIVDDQVTEVTARIGDNPALNMALPAEGLVVAVHETTDNRLTYTQFAKFEKFVAHKAFPDVIAQHKARGISEEKFVETYRRYAKSLIGVGHSRGFDRATGLKTEIVALANPYTDTLSEMPVQVLLDGAPRVDAQVELFERDPAGAVAITLHRTGSDGKVAFPVKPGHAYLVDAVWAEALANDDAAEGPVWKTHWAALSFAVAE